MNTALALSLGIFFLFGVPIAVAIGLASVIGIEAQGPSAAAPGGAAHFTGGSTAYR